MKEIIKVIEKGNTNKVNANKLSVTESLQIKGGNRAICSLLLPCGTGDINLCPKDKVIDICLDISNNK